jgi:integrase
VYATREDAVFALGRHRIEVQETKRGLRRLAPSNRTFDELCDEWLRTRACRKRSRDSDESFIRAHLMPAFGGLPLSAIGVREVETFKAQRSHLHPNTVNHHLSLLISMMRHAHDLSWIAVVPKIAKYRITVAASDFRYLRTSDEVRRFLLAAREIGADVGAMYATAVFTGMRAGELAGVRWDDIDFERRLITVQRSYDGPTKNGEARHIPIVDPLLPILREHRLVTKGQLVFPNRAGEMHRKSDRVFQETLHRVLVRAGLSRGHITFHCLRHSFASHWMMRGGCVFKLQRILGHKTPRMTQRYTHLTPDAFAGDHERLDSLAPTEGEASVVSLKNNASPLKAG